MEQFHDQTKQIVSDYVVWRLSKAGHYPIVLKDKVDLYKNSQLRHFIKMRQIAYEFELRYANEYSPMCDLFSFYESNCRETFFEVINTLFMLNNGEEPCNWSRIVAIISFSGCMAVKCYEEEIQNQIENIIEWLFHFLRDHKLVRQLMDANHNWNGFLEYANERVSHIIFTSEEEVLINDKNFDLNYSYTSNELENSNNTSKSIDSTLSRTSLFEFAFDHYRSQYFGSLLLGIGLVTTLCVLYFKFKA